MQTREVEAMYRLRQLQSRLPVALRELREAKRQTGLSKRSDIPEGPGYTKVKTIQAMVRQLTVEIREVRATLNRIKSTKVAA